MTRIWKGPGVLAGTGDPIYPGQPIPDGHITEERIKQFGDRIETPKAKPPAEKPTSEPEPEPEAKPEPKRGRGRPPGKKDK